MQEASSEQDVHDHATTRIISQREFVIDGVLFQWWAVGEEPALVTVRAKIFGTRSDLTNGDVAAFATALASKILLEHYLRADRACKACAPPALQIPSWVVPDATDFTSTIVYSNCS